VLAVQALPDDVDHVCSFESGGAACENLLLGPSFHLCPFQLGRLAPVVARNLFVHAIRHLAVPSKARGPRPRAGFFVGKARHVPLNSVALDAFRSLLPNMATSNFVFLTQDADNYLRGNRHWFQRVLKEAGIQDFTWHDLRHTFASRLVMAGVGLRSVQELMGHKSINVTARYTHLEPSQQLAAVEKLATFSVDKGSVI
jgi:integrase